MLYILYYVHICNIISYSLNSGTVPSIFKQAIITPILKKPSLDPDSLLNYRPISQLPLVSKILERVVSRQLISYLTANNLHIPHIPIYTLHIVHYIV